MNIDLDTPANQFTLARRKFAVLIEAEAQLPGDRKTICKYIASGLEPPCYGSRQPRAQAIDQHGA